MGLTQALSAQTWAAALDPGGEHARGGGGTRVGRRRHDDSEGLAIQGRERHVTAAPRHGPGPAPSGKARDALLAGRSPREQREPARAAAMTPWQQRQSFTRPAIRHPPSAIRQVVCESNRQSEP